jgi:hypothetical protein
MRALRGERDFDRDIRLNAERLSGDTGAWE